MVCKGIAAGGAALAGTTDFNLEKIFKNDDEALAGKAQLSPYQQCVLSA